MLYYIRVAILFSSLFYALETRADQDQEDAKKAIEIFTKLLSIKEAKPEQIAVVYCERGKAYVELLELEKALQDFDQVIKADSKNSCGFEMTGFVMQFIDRHQSAITYFQKAAALNPQEHRHYLNIGNNFQALGIYDEAITYYDKAIALKPDYALAYFNRGMTYLKQKKTREALKDLTKATNIKPDYAAAWDQRAHTLSRLGRIDDAVKDGAEAIRLDPKNSQYWSNHGVILIKARQLPSALEAFDKSIAYQDDHWPVAIAYYNRAQALMFAGQYIKAEQDARHLMELDDKERTYHRLLGDVFFAQGKWKEAVGEYQEIIHHNKGDLGWEYFHLEAAQLLGHLDLDKKIDPPEKPDPDDFYMWAYQRLAGKSSKEWGGKILKDPNESDNPERQSEAAFYMTHALIEKILGRSIEATPWITKTEAANSHVPIYWGWKP